MVADGPLAADEIDAIIEQLGGEDEVIQGLEIFGRVIDYFNEHQPSLLQKHPHKWVAVTTDGVVAVENSLAEVVDRAKRQGHSNPNLLLRYLDPDPPELLV